jgi:hypothetical protein
MKLRLISLTTFLILALSMVVVPATAHEGREVGDYIVEIGWRVEPAYTGLMNGPEIIVLHGESAAPAAESTPEPEGEHSNDEAEHNEEASNRIGGLEDSLQLEVVFGPASKTLKLRPVANDIGHYVADLIPMRPGDYTFRLFGTIEGKEINETFSASDGLFSTVEPIEDIQFP